MTTPSPASPATSRSAAAAATLELLERSRAGLLEACHSRGVAQRHREAQLAAARAAAALLSARPAGGRQPGPCSPWDLLPAAAPELTEWAEFFAATTSRAEGARSPATAREADDLLRQAEIFLDLVCRSLGLPPAPQHGDVLVPTALVSTAWA